MADKKGSLQCQLGSWALAALAGGLATVLLVVLGGFGWTGAVFLGLVIVVVGGFLLGWLFCRPLAPLHEARASGAAAARGDMAPGALPALDEVAARERGDATRPDTGSHAPPRPAEEAPGPGTAPTGADAGAARTQGTKAGEAAPARPARHDAPGQKPAAEQRPSSVAARGGSAGSTASGSGKDASASAAAPAAVDPGPATANPASDAVTVSDADKPATLPGPRGKADDLKKIKGVGPKLESLLNRMGIYHFDQIAGWTPREVAWVDENLEQFKGRVSRDNWVEQASALADGGR